MKTIATSMTMESLIKAIAQHFKTMPHMIKVDGVDVYFEGVQRKPFSVKECGMGFMFRLDTNWAATQAATQV